MRLIEWTRHDEGYEVSAKGDICFSAFVANNFTKIWTVEKYIETAKTLGAEVVVLRANGRYKNNTGVPQNQINKLISLYEPYPNEIVI